MYVISLQPLRWLQNQASTLGMGGIGKALVCIYLAYKIMVAQGKERIDVEHLELVQNLSMGHEDAKHVADVVAETATMRRVV